MKLSATPPGLTAYFAFGVNWSPQASSGQANSQGNQARPGAGRVIDVEARPVAPSAPRQQMLNKPATKQSNIFSNQPQKPQVTAYAPPEHTGQPVRVLYSAQPCGTLFDDWA